MSAALDLPYLTQFDFHHTLAATPGVAVVLFTAAACANCRHWARLLADCAQSGEVRVFAIDAGHDQALAREFEVMHLPALFLYRDGHFHAGLHCEARIEVLRAAMAAALAAPAEEAP